MVPRAAAETARRSPALSLLATESRLVLSGAVFVAVLFWNLHVQVNQDAWLALAAGRAVVEQGLPHHDWLGVWTAGHTWVDQQWLGHLALYGLESLGGIRLVAAVHALLISAAFTAAIVAGRRFGGSSRSVLYLIPLAFPLLVLSMWQVRTQSLAFPLFVAVVALLARDARTPSARVYVVLPLLCVWSNVHGSVVLGVALTALRGLDLAAGGRRLRGATLGIAGLLSLVASPYGFHVLWYYRSTIFNPAFHALVNEWQPTTIGAATASFFVLLLGAGWLLGRARPALTRFDWLALALSGAAGLDAVRNIGYFALIALMLVPKALDRAWPPARPSAPGRRLDAAISLAALAAAAVVAVNVLGKPASSLVGPNDPVAAQAVAAAGGPVFADVRYADWLVWAEPSLSGRVAYDARFELLSRAQLAKIYAFNDGQEWRAAASGYPVLVLDRYDDTHAVAALERDRHARVLYSGPELVVFERGIIAGR
jgi:hypothetical protein